MLRPSARERHRVADDLIFDAVGVEEIEAAAGVVVGVVEGNEADRLHPRFDRVEIVDLHPDMVERLALGPARFGMLAAGAVFAIAAFLLLYVFR